MDDRKREERSKKTDRLNHKELRDIYLLVGECCELGADPIVWRQHLLKRVNDIVGAIASVEIEATHNPTPQKINAVPHVAISPGSYTDRETKILNRCLREMPLEGNPLGLTLFRRCELDDVAAASRTEAVHKKDWDRCEFVTHYLSELGWYDNAIVMKKSMNGFRQVCLTREKNDSPFSPRSARMLDVLFRELTSISTVRLAPLHGNSLMWLPPRMREVLMALVEGDSEKQVSVRLGISRSTVHEYVRRLLERYGVGSRSELLIRVARQVHALGLVNQKDCLVFRIHP